MTLYAPRNVHGITMIGGCKDGHNKGEADRLVVTCAVCEPLILKHKLPGWASSAAAAALTEEEIAQLEHEKAQGDEVMRGAGQALAEFAKQAMAEKAPA